MRCDRFLNFVDLVNRLNAEAKMDRRGQRADSISRLDFHVRDGLDDLPFRGEQRAATVPLDQQAPRAYVGRLAPSSASDRACFARFALTLEIHSSQGGQFWMLIDISLIRPKKQQFRSRTSKVNNNPGNIIGIRLASQT